MTSNTRTRTRTSLGAFPTADGTTFRLWSPPAKSTHVVLFDDAGNETIRHALRNVGDGVHETHLTGVTAGARYKFDVDGQLFPDPYGRWLPDGVHDPAVVWASTYEFKHDAPDVRPEQLVIYELHVGTFTPEGTYAAARQKLPHLRELGVTCVELLPLSAFPGERGWGYDGVAHFAPFAPYGAPEELQAFVDDAHAHGMIVLLDIVYNHFGPSGNYLGAYSQEYFTDRHKTPWGQGLNYENAFMRHLVLDSAEHWLRTYRFDGFRLDATHAIADDSSTHVLEELAQHVHALGSSHYLFCEDDRNLPALVTDYHMDGMWADDFHHQLRVCLTGERDGYFQAYDPDVRALARCIERGWLYEGQEWPLGERHRRGYPADTLKATNFVYCIQNHDQIGNRALGDRLQDTAGRDGFMLASTVLLFLPSTPLLFMGQEWMATTPFQYFSDHEGELGEAISTGRVEEFGHFEAFKDPATRARIPDPQAVETFRNSKLDWSELDRSEHASVLAAYRDLLRLRSSDAVMQHASRSDMQAGASGDVLWVRRWHAGEERVLLANFSTAAQEPPEIDGVNLGAVQVVFSTGGASSAQLPARSAVILAGRRA